jgi:hypothetical protein
MASSQAEAKDVRASGYDNVLLAAQREGHGGGFHAKGDGMMRKWCGGILRLQTNK